MPTMVPVHTVVLQRPHPQGRKDKEGNVVHNRVVPRVGQPFDFTDEEVKQFNEVNPEALRKPVNEGGKTLVETADQAAEEAARLADKTAKAAGDAASVTRTAALGKGARKQTDNAHAGEAPGPEAESEDEL